MDVEKPGDRSSRKVHRSAISFLLIPLGVGLVAAAVGWLQPPRYLSRMVVRLGGVYAQPDGQSPQPLSSPPESTIALLAMKEFQTRIFAPPSKATDEFHSDRLEIIPNHVPGTEIVELKASAATPQACVAALGDLERELARRYAEEVARMRRLHGTGSPGVRILVTPMEVEVKPALPQAPDRIPPWKLGMAVWGLTLGIILCLSFLASGEKEPAP